MSDNPDENIIICRCEDVTKADVLKAIRGDGLTDLESLRHHLNIGRGPCQGKTCIPLVTRILRQETGKGMDEIGLPTARPPIRPIPLGVLNIKDKEGDE